MSRPVRLVVALLISFLLPLTGMAGMVAPMQPYPAQQLAMADMVGMDHSCFDEEDEEKSAELVYKVCKTGQEDCQAPAMFTIPAMKTPVAPSGETLLAVYHPSVPLANADSFWRPPRF